MSSCKSAVHYSIMGSLYHIGGELYLPDPGVCGLDSKHLAVARSLQPLLKIVDADDISSK